MPILPPPPSTIELPTSAPSIREWVVDVQDAEEGTTRFSIPDGGLTFGTSPSADVQMQDPSVSAMHCKLMVESGMVSIVDLGSTNGTFIGGARVAHVYAMAGEIVTLGRSSIAVKAAYVEEDEPLGLPLTGIVGDSLPMRRLADRVRRAALHKAPVLIIGETGSGKELVARALHRESARASKAFIPINVAALPRDLVESEMFGHERGAFTGAHQRKAGAFGDAEGGTLFLDEIGDLPIDAQPKLLRALDGYEVKRVGQDGRGQRFDTRVIAATHVNLKERVLAGTFRQDLFHRLDALVVRIPPLRARRGDIALLASALFRTMDLPSGPPRLLAEALSVLNSHDWPGNVRELRHTLFRAAVESDGAVLTAADVRAAIDKTPEEPRSEVTLIYAKQTLAKCQGNISRAAREAGLPRTTFRRLVEDELTTAPPGST